MSALGSAPTLDLAGIVDAGCAFLTTEYASLTRGGAPVTWPVTPFRGAAGTIDVSTGLAYPLKAERARRDRRVALAFTHPVGSGLVEPASFVVQGLASVRDADLRATSARYLQAAADRFPQALGSVPDPLLRRMAFYWTRAWVEVTPLRVWWWPAGDLSRPPLRWEAPAGTTAPPSDPAPLGRSAGSWAGDGGSAGWRRRAAGVVERLGPPVLTVVDADGWPLPVPARSARPTPDGFAVVPPAGVAVADGPAFLTFHHHGEVFDGQENVGLAGSARVRGGEVHVQVERALADWGVPRNPLLAGLRMWRAGRRLTPRLHREAARRGQRPPSFDDLGFRRPPR